MFREQEAMKQLQHSLTAKLQKECGETLSPATPATTARVTIGCCFRMMDRYSFKLALTRCNVANPQP
jgi:hypothetical protein